MTSVFHPLEDYRSQNGSYQLLPFKFEPISSNEVLLTNAAGEFAYLVREKLDVLVSHRLRSDDQDYIDLRAKHFLREPEDLAPIEFLSLKLRTKLHNLSNFTNLHIFVVTLRCDHSCQYCQVSRQSEDRQAFDMTVETATNALELVFRSPSPAIKIEFQGGESLLNFPLIKLIVEQAEERNKHEKRDLQFVIATTLSLATEEILRYCRDHSIFISSSLDGPEDLHNRNRPRPGRDSHQKFVEHLEKARDIVGYHAVSALMTTSPASLTRVREIIDEYIRLGFNGIFLRHLSPYGFAIKTKSYKSYDVEKWLQFYREGLDYIIQVNKSGHHFVEHYSQIILTKMLTSNDPGFVDLMNPAGAGIAAVVYNYDGDVYASDESRMLNEMGDKKFKLGNVSSNTYEQIFASDVLLDTLEQSFTTSVPMCSDCAFEPWCGADPVFHYATQGDVVGRKPSSEFCKRMMGVSKHLLHTMRSEPAAKQVFMRWVGGC